MKNYLSGIDLQNLKILFGQAPVALAMLRGKDLVIEAANEQILGLWQRDASVIGSGLLEAIPELKDQAFPNLLLTVLQTGESYKGTNELAVINGKESYFDFIYAPLYEGQEIIGVSVVATDVTERVIAKQQLKDSEFLYRDLILSADVSTAIYLGEDLIIGLANEQMLKKTWGRDESIIGKKLEEAIPELEGQPFIGLLQNVLRTGETYFGKDDKVDFIIDGEKKTFYYNFSYKPLRNTSGKIYGILNMAVDVTEQVKAKKDAEQSEAFLNDFIQNAPMAVSIMEGRDLIIKVTNKKTTELWSGIKGRLGMKLIDAYPDYEGTETHLQVLRAFDTGQQVEVKDHEVKKPDGSSKFINYILKPVRGVDNVTKYIISIGYDVTEDVLNRKKLKASEEQFRNLANSIPQLVFKADGNGFVNYYNDQWYEFTGFPRDEFGDKSWKDIVKPDQFDKMYNAWYDSVKTGKPYHIEYEFKDRSKPGQYRWFLGQAIPIKNEKGEIVEWLGTCTDIHEIKLLQSQKDTFLGIASHELKTPLTSLKLYSQVLEKNLIRMGDEKNAGLAVKMDNQLNKLSSLIGDLLDVTKIQNGQMVFSEEEFDFNELVKEVVGEIQISTSHKILLETGGGEPVFGDKARISQVISNLISNAIKYSPDADTVIVETRLTGENVVLSVQDFGIGLEDDKKDKVFEQYYRVSGAEEHTFPGLGLGLYISSEIIKRTGGRIWVNSVAGKGSTFCFEIPKYKSEKRNER